MDDQKATILPFVRPISLDIRDDATLKVLRETAARAVCRPESLTMNEVQELGWAFLMAAKSSKL